MKSEIQSDWPPGLTWRMVEVTDPSGVRRMIQFRPGLFGDADQFWFTWSRLLAEPLWEARHRFAWN